MTTGRDTRQHSQLTSVSVALMLVYGALLLSINLGGARVLTQHEVFYAQPAKEMLATGRWLIPMFAGVPRVEKAPLMYWSIAVAMEVFGSTSEWVPRLASVAAALLTALTIAALSARWLGNLGGLFTGLIELTTVGLLIKGRLAEPDMLLTAAVCLAMSAFGLGNLDSPSAGHVDRRLARAFCLATGLAFLAKGPIGLALILTPCLLFVASRRDWRAMRFLMDPIGLVIGLLLVLPWSLAAYAVYPNILPVWVSENWALFRGELEGHQPVLFYAYTVPWVMLPWTPFGIFGIVTIVRRRQLTTPVCGFLGLWFLSGVSLLTASAGKHWHYVLPAVPPLAVLAARGLLDYGAWPARQSRAHAAVMAASSVAGCVVAFVVAPRFLEPAVARAVSILVAVLGGGLLIAVLLGYRRGFTAQLAALFGTAWILPVLVYTFLMPSLDSYRDQTEFARRTTAIVAGRPLYLVNLPQHQITYYLSGPLVRIDDVGRLAEHFAGGLPTEIFVVGPQRVAESLSKLGHVDILDRCLTLRRHMKEQNRLTLMKLSSARFEFRNGVR